MASRQFNQFTSSLRFGLKFLEGAAKVGASGQIVANSFTGGGISATSTLTLVNIGTGLYRLQVQDPYVRCVSADIKIASPTSGSTIAVDGNLVVGQPYQILGGTSAVPAVQPTTSTNWYTLGLYPGLNPAAGEAFVATSGASNVPGSSTSQVGQGQVARIITSGVASVEILPGINTTLAPTSASSGMQGAIIQFQTLNTSNALANPVANTWLRWNLWLDSSSRLQYNESSTSN